MRMHVGCFGGGFYVAFLLSPLPPHFMGNKNLCAFCGLCVPLILHVALSVVTVY